MNRLKRHLSEKAHEGKMSFLAQIHAEIAPQLQAMKDAWHRIERSAFKVRQAAEVMVGQGHVYTVSKGLTIPSNYWRQAWREESGRDTRNITGGEEAR